MTMFPVQVGMQEFICVQCAKSLSSCEGEEHDGSSVQDCTRCQAKTNVGVWINQRQHTHASRHEDRIRGLASEIGYGHLMQLCEKLWRQELAQESLAGDELTVGPAARFLVPCPCGAEPSCDLCCGSGRVLPQVRNTFLDAAPLPLLLWCPGCGERHIDADDMKEHKTHACQHCGMTWRPANWPTRGVRFLPGCKDD